MEFHSAALWHSIAPALGAPPIICRAARSLRPLTEGATPAVLSWIRAGAKILSALEPSRSIWEWSQGPAGARRPARCRVAIMAPGPQRCRARWRAGGGGAGGSRAKPPQGPALRPGGAAGRGGAGRNSRQAPAGASAAPWVADRGTARVIEPANALGLWQERPGLAGLGRAPDGQPGAGKAGL